MEGGGDKVSGLERLGGGVPRGEHAVCHLSNRLSKCHVEHVTFLPDLEHPVRLVEPEHEVLFGTTVNLYTGETGSHASPGLSLVNEDHVITNLDPLRLSDESVTLLSDVTLYHEVLHGEVGVTGVTLGAGGQSSTFRLQHGSRVTRIYDERLARGTGIGVLLVRQGL